jgi:hypothetical protein
MERNPTHSPEEAPMSSTHSITITPKAASERGALDGHKVACSCGYHQATSLGEREARRLGFDHIDWASRNGR